MPNIFNTLTIISSIMESVLALYFFWLLLCDIIGLFCKKRQFSEAEPYNFAVVICARNEEKVIGNLLDSLNKQNYPEDKRKIFVVAHNCTDNTAAVAENHGATVLLRNEPSESFKGQALHFGIDYIKKNYPDCFEAFCVFDADNVAGLDFLKEINAALHSGADVVQGFRNSKNYYASTVSEMFGAYWYQIMICQNLPQTAMKLPATMSGTGFAVLADSLPDGWDTLTMLEDIEFTCQMAIAGKRCILAPYAMFYDEQPVSFKIAMRQRYRWAVGGYQVLKIYLPKLLKAIPKQGAKAVKMIVDILINPVLLISLLGFFMQIIIAGIKGGADAGAFGALKDIAAVIFGSAGAVWLSVLPTTFILFIKQRMNPFKNFRTVLLFPFFLLISMVFAIPALLDRNPKWKPIPHTDTKTIDMLESNPD